MKYDVKHSCGHLEEVNLVGPNKDRAYRMAAMREQPCRACKIVMSADATNGLPALVGSDRQVAWALDLRGKFVAKVETFLAELRDAVAAAPAEDADEARAYLARYESRFAKIQLNQDAKFWIDNRFTPTAEILALAS